MARPPVDRGRLERPDQPDVLRDARLPEALRLQARQGDRAHAPGTRGGQGDRLERDAREGRARRRAPPRAWALGDAAPGLRVPSAPIERTKEGDFRVHLSADERALLRGLTGQLEELLRADPDDPSLRRLTPPAYEEDEAGEREFRSLMGAELDSRHRQSLRLLAETADRDRLGAEELDSWLTALNDLRLVLGTRLDVTEDLFADGFDPHAPDAHELAVYAFLTWLQEAAVEAAADSLQDAQD